MVVKDEKALGKALEEEEETIKITGDLASKIKKIWYLDKTLWYVCFACLAIAVAALLMIPATLGGTMAVSMVAGTPAAVVMGIPTASSAVLTAVAGGGIKILKRLRCSYRLEQIDNSCIILYKK